MSQTHTPACSGTEPYRILLYNVGYGTEIDGSLRSYLLRFYRYIYTPMTVMRRVRRAVYGLLNEVKPDLCCFVEVHRRRGAFHPRFYRHGDTANKYGLRSLLRCLPFFRDNCNGFLSRSPMRFAKRYFTCGTKKLIYEITLRSDLRLLFAHFSLNASVRQRQCRELAEMIRAGSAAIVCGDFNIFDGVGELRSLADRCNLRIIRSSGGPTFPTAHPTKALDLFLCPESLLTAQAKVLSSIHESDHLPVLLEVRL